MYIYIIYIYIRITYTVYIYNILRMVCVFVCMLLRINQSGLNHIPSNIRGRQSSTWSHGWTRKYQRNIHLHRNLQREHKNKKQGKSDEKKGKKTMKKSKCQKA